MRTLDPRFGIALWMAASAFAQTFPHQVGVEVSDRPSGFVDVGKTQRPFNDPSGKPVPIDANGWPATDGLVVMMDDRAVPIWLGAADDPTSYQPDESGKYKVSFQGQAAIADAVPAGLVFANQKYDAATNTTSMDVTLPKGLPNLIILEVGYPLDSGCPYRLWFGCGRCMNDLVIRYRVDGYGLLG